MTLRILLILSFVIQSSFAQFLSKKTDLQTANGFFTFHYDDSSGEIYMEVDELDTEFLYVHSLKSGIGSNDLGLDRGQLGGTSIVKFIKAGNKLLLMERNQDYRAMTDNSAEKKSIAEAFGKSVLYGFEIKETKGKTYVIDLTPFLMEDAHQVTDKLKKAKEGTYKVDATKSAILMENTKSFPKNTEFEALLTLKGDPEGKMLRTVVPTPGLVTIVQHHSFVELPDDGYTPREFDPRAGLNAVTFMDFASPIQESITKRFIRRHRLEKKNPEAEISEPVEPIIYYLDPGTPEPVRSALLEGVSWWDQAFAAAGYKNAFQVKMLPEGADPMDLRYNVVQWVHRSTRGWSYGASVSDPRTGEILKGHVSLGSLRIRQDFLIAQALMNKPFAKSNDNYEPMLEMALARIRQLGAHEVGHTLGFSHNFAASVNDRASVMDYPHPTLTLKGKEVDFSNAYDTGIGEWDKVTVAYAYGNAPDGDSEEKFLDKILTDAEAKGLRFITDSDARAADGAHPDAHLWDNGASASEELKNVLKLRQQAIQNFSIDNIKDGEAYSVLEDVFVPLYFYHRYQTEAAIKVIGGQEYNYAVKGDPNLVPVAFIDTKTQEDALKSVLLTLNAEHLAIPKDKLALFPPRAFGYERTRESFKGDTGVTFDALGAAATASDMTLTFLLNPERANRLVENHAIDNDQLGLDGLLEALENATLGNKIKDDYKKEVQHTINHNVIKHLKNLYVSKKAIPQVKAKIYSELTKIAENARDENRYVTTDIEQFLKEPQKFEALPSPTIPDGSPIGSYMCPVNLYE
ncbi:zinc-dependent metalloprotease [Flavimarina sp. Hel_I_48]|uniref:zinc-dependent metalloprotease n=1 Tax=Flavimarina sp. Hel_I_48 TaxID=1392488 RepID=UPI0004DF7BF7|nr:zinc-dependent metalloprotease [Flavimarina sp. Hel_I_48]